jgi:hypothetical protein
MQNEQSVIASLVYIAEHARFRFKLDASRIADTSATASAVNMAAALTIALDATRRPADRHTKCSSIRSSTTSPTNESYRQFITGRAPWLVAPRP